MRNICLCIAILLWGTTLTAQTTDSSTYSDIAIRASLGSSPLIGLEYRKSFKNKQNLRWVIGANYTNESHFNYRGEIVSASDTLVTYRNYSQNWGKGDLRFGIERRFSKFPQLSLRASFLLGYSQLSESYSNISDTLGEDGKWSSSFGFEFDDFEFSYISRHYLNTGVAITAGLDLPISNRFIFNANVSQVFDAAFHLGDSGIQDPKNEFGSAGNYFNADTRIGIGLRYILSYK